MGGGWGLELGIFHGVVNGRKASNAIPGLMVDGLWVSKPTLVKKEVLRHFRSHFADKFKTRPKLRCDNLKKIDMRYGERLIAIFTRDEIKDPLFDCGSDRAPGPDGFNFRFVKFFWSFLEDDFVNLMNHFHDCGVISRGCSSSFITLIPKTKSHVGLKDYRPINLVGIISKVISRYWLVV